MNAVGTKGGLVWVCPACTPLPAAIPQHTAHCLLQGPCLTDHPAATCTLQGEAIAVNLREMFGLRVPIISVVIGEGGSGGALAIGKLQQLEGIRVW